MEKTPCGGFYIDDRLFYFEKDEITGRLILSASEDAIRGVQGEKGEKGDPFTIDKIYSSIEAMNADHENSLVPVGSFVLIENEGNPQHPDNGKLYDKTEHGFSYITNLSGAQGIKGEKGDTGAGLPSGGHAGQVLVKSNEGDYATHWETLDIGQTVALSREYGTAPNDHGFYREWTPNPQGKVWVECGVFIKTVALSVGSNVPLPVTFEDGYFHVQVTVMEMGNYSAKAYRSGNNRSINVLVTDYYGTPKAVNICVEAKGWKQI